MLTLRQRIFIVLGIVAAIIVAVVLFFLVVRAPQDTQDVIDDTIVDSATGPLILDNIATPRTDTVSQTTGQGSEEIYVKNIARIFVERFQTFSNQNNNEHIDDVLSLATAEMQAWMKTQTVSNSSVYEGMTTRVLTSSVESFSDIDAVVKIGARCTKTDVSGGADHIELTYATVLLKKIQDEWKVAGLFWE